MDCDDCGGNGNEECYHCDGSGSVEDNYKVEVNVYEYITISNHIFNIVESEELNTPIEYSKYDLILSDRETIRLYSYGVTTGNFDTDLKGEEMIAETNKTDILLAKQSNGFIRDNFLSDID
jgi:DnaJ-class molecular chaperone